MTVNLRFIKSVGIYNAIKTLQKVKRNTLRIDNQTHISVFVESMSNVDNKSVSQAKDQRTFKSLAQINNISKMISKAKSIRAKN